MNDDYVTQAKNKAKLQKEENQQSNKEQELRSQIDQNKTQTLKLENHNKELYGKIQSHPNKPTPEQNKEFEKNSQEYKGNIDQIQKYKQELPQKQQELKDFQTKEQAKTQGDKIKNAGAERGHERYAVSPNATGTKKGDLKREYHQSQPNPRQPEAPTSPNSKEAKDMNYQNKDKLPNSPLTQQAKDKAKENQSKPKEQQQTQSKQNEQDNER